MPVSCDPESTPEPRAEEHEILLRLGDILPRVPAHYLKPGPHDVTTQVRFSVDELAEKIARGRVSVPLDRLASAYPEVFRDNDAFPGEQEIQLPLQKLLEQVGVIARKAPAPNGVPVEQIAQARVQAGRIIEAVSPAAAAPEPAAPVPPDAAKEPQAVEKKKWSWRSVFGLGNEMKERAGGEKKPASAADAKAPETALPALSKESPPEPANQPTPEGCISLHLLPIFRLLPADVRRTEALPADDVRIVLPLAVIDPQLTGGHVEISIEDFVKTLPVNLRLAINPIPETRVWIPLDEIFQNLPPSHLFYMPPLEPEAPATPEPTPAEINAEPKDAPAAETEPPKPAAAESAPVEPAPVDKPSAEPHPETAPPAAEIEPPKLAAPESAPVEPAAAEQPSPELQPETAPPAAEIELPKPAAPESAPVEPAPVEKPSAESQAETVPPVAEIEPKSARSPEPAPSPESAPAAEPILSETETASAASPPSRAPWMRGFQVPPPVLVPGGIAHAEASPDTGAADPMPAPAPTPEARRTVDFLASQPGVSAAAAFVEGAVFASADFPRKPDLGALRDFMGSFVNHAQESGRRLGWNRVLTIACEQVYVTAIVRDTHFIVALHHERVLSSLAHDALITAADDLSKAAI